MASPVQRALAPGLLFKYPKGLPSEIWWVILAYVGVEYFPMVAQVCRAFYEVCTTRSLLNKLSTTTIDGRYFYHQCAWDAFSKWLSVIRETSVCVYSQYDELKKSTLPSLRSALIELEDPPKSLRDNPREFARLKSWTTDTKQKWDYIYWRRTLVYRLQSTLLRLFDTLPATWTMYWEGNPSIEEQTIRRINKTLRRQEFVNFFHLDRFVVTLDIMFEVVMGIMHDEASAVSRPFRRYKGPMGREIASLIVSHPPTGFSDEFPKIDWGLYGGKNRTPLECFWQEVQAGNMPDLEEHLYSTWGIFTERKLESLGVHAVSHRVMTSNRKLASPCVDVVLKRGRMEEMALLLDLQAMGVMGKVDEWMKENYATLTDLPCDLPLASFLTRVLAPNPHRISPLPEEVLEAAETMLSRLIDEKLVTWDQIPPCSLKNVLRKQGTAVSDDQVLGVLKQAVQYPNRRAKQRAFDACQERLGSAVPLLIECIKQGDYESVEYFDRSVYSKLMDYALKARDIILVSKLDKKGYRVSPEQKLVVKSMIVTSSAEVEIKDLISLRETEFRFR